MTIGQLRGKLMAYGERQKAKKEISERVRDAHYAQREKLGVDWRDNTVSRCTEFFGSGQTCQNRACPYAVGTMYADGHLSGCVHIFANTAV